MTDPNWLLSTTAQSTAALVAIVGGFLISRAIAFSSEKSSLSKQLYEIETLLAVAKRDLELATEEVFEGTFKWFTEHYLENVMAERGAGARPDDRWMARGSTTKDDEKMWSILNRYVREALIAVEGKFVGGSLLPISTAELRSEGIEVPLEAENIYLNVAINVGANRRVLLPDSALLDVVPVEVPLIENQDIFLQRHDQSIVKRDDLSSQVLSYSAQRRILEFDIQRLAQPQGLTSGLLVLGLFGFLGIIFPLTLMAFRPVSDVWYLRLLVLLGFVAGFAGLLVYIYFSFRNLHERSGSRRRSAGPSENTDNSDR